MAMNVGRQRADADADHILTPSGPKHFKDMCGTVMSQPRSTSGPMGSPEISRWLQAKDSSDVGSLPATKRQRASIGRSLLRL